MAKKNAEGAIAMSGLDNPPTAAGLTNKHEGESNPSNAGWSDVADAAQFQTNPADVAGSHKGQGGHAASTSPISQPIA